MTGVWLVLAKIAIIITLLFFVSGSIAVTIDLWLTKRKNRAALSKQPEELEAQTLTALEIMSLSDVTKPEIESAIATLHELGALLSDNGDSRVEVMNAAVELLGDILREAAKTNK